MRRGRWTLAALWAFIAALILQVGLPASWDTPLSSGTAHAATEQKFAVDIGAGCAVTDTGDVWCWGEAYDGRLGDGRYGWGYAPMPTPIPIRTPISGIVAMGGGTCAVDAANQVSCWGFAGSTEDGDGSLFSSPPWGTASPRAYGFSPSSKVAGTCALTLTGIVQCYGWDNFGQLGRGGLGWPGMGYPHPPPSSGAAGNVPGLTDVVDISSAISTVCAVKSDGTVWCWGLNENGAVGNGESGNDVFSCPQYPNGCHDWRYESLPVQVIGIDDAVSVHGSCAIREGGKVSCWGRNDRGRFTSAPEATVYPATEIPQFEGAVDLDVDRYSTCVAYQDGSALCRGGGFLGGGLPDTATRQYAEAVLPLENVREIESVGYNSRCARMADGTIACWGGNYYGELGNGVYGHDRYAVWPQFVVGFGGEIPEPELRVDVEFDPSELKLELDDAGDPVPTEITVKVKVTNTSQTDDVENIRLENVLERYHDRGPTPSGLQQPNHVPQAELEWASLAPGESVTAELPVTVDNYGDFGVGATAVWDAPDTGDRLRSTGRGRITVELDDGFEVEVTGEATNNPSVVRIIAKISNTATGLLDGITWASDGMTLDIIEGAEPLTLGAPSSALPSSLSGGESVTVAWDVSVADVGTGVFGLNGIAQTALGKPAEAFQELSAQVTAGLIKSIDLYKEVLAGVENQLAAGAAEGEAMREASLNEVANETERFRQQEYDSWIGLGFDDRTARFLASGAVNRQAVNNYFSGMRSGASSAIADLGASDGESLWRMYDTITDPVKRSAFAAGLLQMARDEYGYLESGFSNPGSLGAVDLQIAYDAWGDAAVATRDSVRFAASGQVDIWAIEAGEFQADPLRYSGKVGNRHGGQGATVAYYTSVGVAEEFATGGLGPITRAGRAVEGGVDTLRNASRGSEAVDAGTDAVGSATRRLAEGEEAAKRFQDLPYGSIVDGDQLELLGGFSTADAARIDGIIAEVKQKYGVDVQMVFRTAEPMSVGIDGVGKRAFTKEKAVGQLDIMLGAPEELAGKVTIFKPEPLPRAVLEEIEWDNPGFTARYQERLAIQQKNWDAFQAGSARTQKIAEASEKYGGVHVLDGVPGRPTYGVDYMEQLTDPDYLASRPDLTPAQIAELQSYPATTYTNLEIDVVDGAYTVSDKVRVRQPDGSFADVKKPVISDYDGQAVLPEGGEWPAGIRGQVETYIKAEMNKIGRSGRHGWSDAANDLPAEYFNLAAEYVMSTTHPSVAGRVAKDLERRFNLLADEFVKKADRLEATISEVPAGPQRAKRQAQIDKLRATAATYRGLNAAEIMKKWPPGEKTIVFTAGRISVGSNQGLP